jgi:energy-coupling factor transporter ATP-binding protein EcfA2
MTQYIKSVKATAVHGRFDLECEFSDGVNIVYGENGSGKTTLLHILANVLNADYQRFVHLRFREIEVRMSDGASVNLRLRKARKVGTHHHLYVEVNGAQASEEFCERRMERARRDRVAGRGRAAVAPRSFVEDVAKLPLSVAYFPAFRTAIDAWAANQDNPQVRRSVTSGRPQAEKTDFARILFGNFVPRLDYPATSEIESTLNDQVRTAIAQVSRADRQYFGEVPSGILEMLSNPVTIDRDPKDLLEEIKALALRFEEYPIHVESTWTELAESVRAVPNSAENTRVAAVVLSVYKTALERIVRRQERSFARIERYLLSVNSFLKDKNITISSSGGAFRGTPFVKIEFGGDRPAEAQLHSALSSGERQIVTLIYASTQMSQQEVILVDEPEISLHVDWQRRLLPAMIEQMPSKQLIVCTHSPVIGTQYRNRMQELAPSPTTYGLDDSPELDMFLVEEEG